MATMNEARAYGRGKVWQFAGVELTGETVYTANHTLTGDDPRFVPFSTAGGAFTLTLPAAPYDGMTYNFSENVGTATALLISGNGNNIDGVANLTMNAAYRQRVLRYNGTQWIVIGGIG